MDLAKILESLNSPATSEKTASDAMPASNGRLEVALREAMEAQATIKTASDNTARPTDDLTKIAQRLATAEQEALVKEAELYGAAVCDGFMARMGSYEGVKSTKTASYGNDFEKFASENPDLVKQAAELGYRETREKIAAATQSAYNEGYTKVAHLVKEAAEQVAVRGYNDTLNVLRSLR